jgi:hypothetical protein
VGATDDLSGVDHVNIWFTKSLNYGYPNSSVTGNSTLFGVYDFQDSFSEGTIKRPTSCGATMPARWRSGT